MRDNITNTSNHTNTGEQEVENIAQECIDEIKQHAYNIHNKRLEDLFTIINNLRTNLNQIDISTQKVELILRKLFSSVAVYYSTVLTDIGKIHLMNDNAQDIAGDERCAIDPTMLKAALKELIEYYRSNAKIVRAITKLKR